MSADTKTLPINLVADATCTRCGCLCDDIDVVVSGNQIIEARRACELGQAWFLNRVGDELPDCRVEGQPAKLKDGIERAAEILAAAKYPIVYGLSGVTSEAQRVAVGIADWIGGNVDTPTSDTHGLTGVSFQGVGEVTCSLGEIANRGDLVIFWGANPAEHQPRHFERYSLEPQGMFLPGGRADRTAVLIGSQKTATAAAMDIFLQIKPDRDFEALWTLRALAKGIELDPRKVLDDTGIELARWQDLIQRMKKARFGVFLYDEQLTTGRGEHVNAEALLALVRDMNAFTRFVTKSMGGRGNPTGAENVVLWRTGYPFAVNFSRGYPRFNPGEYSADELLARGEADAALIVGDDPLATFSAAAKARLRKIPLVTIDFQDTATVQAATVAVTTATYGIHTAGTVSRTDEVPLPLRPAIRSTHPDAVEVLKAIERRVCELLSFGAAGCKTESHS